MSVVLAAPFSRSERAWVMGCRVEPVSAVLGPSVSWANAENARRDAADALVMICKFRFI
jgi:hypothetical protein